MTEGYDVIGFDIERHEYGEHRYPGHLVLQDVLTLHGSQFRDAALIVASPPCQAYSYRAMPWSRAKALPPPDNTLFEACFRIQHEACEAAGRYIPLIVENVRGAQKWVGRARWNYGSFYLWGDVPALMPFTFKGVKVGGLNWSRYGQLGYKGEAFNTHAERQNPDGRKVSGHLNQRDGHDHTRHLTNPAEHGVKHHGSGAIWFDTGPASLPSASPRRKAASAMIAKIPQPLARHIGMTFRDPTFLTSAKESEQLT